MVRLRRKAWCFGVILNNFLKKWISIWIKLDSILSKDAWANKDSEIELLICFCLIMDNAESQNDEGNTITYDFGNIGFQAKKFNPDWNPKKI